MIQLVARQVLNDCIRAHNQLDAAEDDPDEWRVKWIGALAILRMVGHVLHKIDGRNPRVASVQATPFAEWNTDDPAHLVFREFINRHRNLALKEYQVLVDERSVIPLVATLGEGFEIPSDLYRPITEGYGEGEDARDVYLEAIKWWDKQLSGIEAMLG